jgi:hypothetical protein
MNRRFFKLTITKANTMNRTQRTVLVAAAMTGIVAGCMLGSGCAKSSDNTVTNAPDTNAPGTNAPTGDAGKHDCQGKNSCKGQGGCGADKGKNTCAGKGGCNTKGSCKAA